MHRAIHETPDHTRWAVANQLRTHDLRNYKKKTDNCLKQIYILKQNMTGSTWQSKDAHHMARKQKKGEKV